MYNDTSSMLYKMTAGIVQQKGDKQNTYEFSLTDSTFTPSSFDISGVYALSFYYQSSFKTSLIFSYASSNNWSKENTIELKASPGEYYVIPLTIFANRFEFDISKLSKVKIKVESKYDFAMNEIDFNYTSSKSRTEALKDLNNKLNSIKTKRIHSNKKKR